MKIIDVEQGSQDWFKVRCGIPTASCFDKIITTKGEPSKSRQKYLYQLAGEAIIGYPEETYQNAAMLRGTELEPEARAMYELITGEEVAKAGFCLGNGYGASPDGFVGDRGMVQIKCPQLSTHVEYLINNKIPTDYFQQVQGELFVAEKDWSDFVSYYPAMKPLIVRVQRDQKFIELLEQELELFCVELDLVIIKLKENL